MIKAHPTPFMLRAFAADELPLPLAVGISAHCELCPDCRVGLHAWEAELAAHHLAGPDRQEEGCPPGLDAMLANILQQPILSPPALTAPFAPGPELWVAEQRYPLPRVLARYQAPTWLHVGPIRQHRLPLDEMGARASLLHLDAGGSIPEHRHQGYELTLLLAGNMHDGDASYQAGDFIWCEAGRCHSPHTPDGCLCYQVLDGPVRFTKRLSRLLRGLSHRLY